MLKLKTVEAPAVGNKPLFRVTVCQDKPAVNVSKIFPFPTHSKAKIIVVGRKENRKKTSVDFSIPKIC